MSQMAVWIHVRRSDSSILTVLPGKRFRFAEQGSLTIKQVDLSDAGQYTCIDSDHRYIALYQLDVRMQEQRVVVSGIS